MPLLRVICSFAFGFAPSLASDTVSLVSDRDNTMYSEDGTLANGAGEHVFSGQTGTGSTRRALVRFDVAAAIPAGSTVLAATLRMTVSKTQVGDRLVALHRARRDWGEAGSIAGGDGGGGGPAEDGDATWTHTDYPSALWARAGGDYEPTSSAIATAGLVDTIAVWSSPELIADVQRWIADPTRNFGWVLRHVDEGPTGSTKRFGSRENILPGYRPTLEIEYEPRVCNATSTCAANPNSTGSPASLTVSGSCAISDASFTLTAAPVPDQPFLFFHGPDPAQIPFGDGFLCISGRLVRVLPPGLASGQVATATLDLGALGLPPGPRRFQCWYRDPAAGGTGFNTSDAVMVVLTP